jgi:hypothetical protein
MQFFEEFISELTEKYTITTEKFQKHPILDYRCGNQNY